MRITILALASMASAFAQTSLTIYNQNFAVIRDSIPLDLKAGTNTVQYTGATVHLEPDSVMLRDLSGRTALRILEQNFRAEPVSEGLLLNLFEGKEIDFEVTAPGTGERRQVRGKIIRSGYVPHLRGIQMYGGTAYAARQTAYVQSGAQPIVESQGKLMFALPGRPIFPALGNNTILKPTLDWQIHADRAAKLDAELSYVSGGLSWKADYNMVAPEKGDRVDVTGWITMDNQSGKDFEKARIKLVGGDVSKVQPETRQMAASSVVGGAAYALQVPAVTERTFDEYHLYTLPRPTTLHDRETKQVEFLRATNVASVRIYVYDGAKIDQRYTRADPNMLRNAPDYGTESNPKVWVMREFDNTEANSLGIALPKGRMRFYRRGDAGALEFTGENNIDHTPRGEKVRVYTGDAFDVVGERKRTNFSIDHNRRTVDESFEIRLRNRKTEPVDVRVVEHLYRGTNWQLTAQSAQYTKTDSKTIEFPVRVGPDKEFVLTYTAHYTW